MSNEIDAEVVQSVLQYYRSKCSQLEYDFIVYKLYTEKRIKELSLKFEKIQEQQKRKKD